MMRLQLFVLKIFILAPLMLCHVVDNNNEISVYEGVPGLEPSPYYSIRLRKEGSSDSWLDTFALVTECTKEKYCNTTNHYENLGNWSNSYINFEMKDGVGIVIEITKLYGEPITKAVVHPYTASKSCKVRNGKAYVIIRNTGLFTVDINGQMDDQDTGMMAKNRKFYDGPPIHTLTIFANPFLDNKPSLEDTGVYQVQPGEEVPSEGPWHTLYFLPGIHDIGLSFPLHTNKTYYIPGDAVVYGTMNNNQKFNDGAHILIYGHGTLSGDRLPHPNHADPPVPDNKHWKFDPINVSGAKNTRVEGITIANSAYHSLMLVAGYDPEKPTDIKWVKIFTWRGNGDGINPFSNALIEDCFIRTQDDSTYVNGRGIRRVVYWNDSNGSTFVLSSIGGDTLNSHPLVVEDCTVVYARAKWNNWSGGRLFNMRGEGEGSGGYSITFRNIKVEDPRPTLQHFMIAMQGVKPYSDPNKQKRGPGDVYGILFQNISIAAPSILGEPDILWGMSDGLIYDLIFDNVVIGNEKIENIDHFHHNEFVIDLPIQ